MVHLAAVEHKGRARMTPLGQALIARIQATGPMPLADYMTECLLHPLHGYYATQDPFGAGGDFVTSPEISQMFGEMLGLCLAQHWLDAGSPATFTLAEFGPGRGTLMADVLRATRSVPGFQAAASITLLEASQKLRTVQKTCLAGHRVTWIDHADQLPEAPLYLLANEFFDALPIRQFTRSGDGWRETMVQTNGQDFCFGLSDAREVSSLTQRLADTEHGSIVELCDAALPIISTIGTRLARFGGLALVVDYGGWVSLGDTFQAMRGHSYVSPLAEPGLADITAHVDFAALSAAAVAAGAKTSYATQGEVLSALGIVTRAERLAKGLEPKALQNHLSGLKRLTASGEMGELFKMLAVYPQSGPNPAGFS